MKAEEYLKQLKEKKEKDIMDLKNKFKAVGIFVSFLVAGVCITIIQKYLPRNFECSVSILVLPIICILIGGLIQSLEELDKK